ncbi:hypothetical protein GQR60_15215 [Labilibaculum sp. A4]|uniref:hypothetical protein n=1 Tax=Labilibaculum euxinus TaxID=2686357 RepID=UPI000F628055|nr:hypothetical protein [Labilibaculum euxinus]MDQ1771787.1 hypothetical protein [Labilibaculum euxinus]MWN77690.1 hypothetical protein [Labilibaculum euxinus]
MKKIYLLIIGLLPLVGMAQKADEVKVKLSGFVTAEAIFDSRKTVNTREGDVILYPAAKSFDANGADLNDRSELFMTTIHSRLNVGVTGFEAFGAKGSATIQGDFVGTSNDKIGLFRLRHAFVKLDWGKDELLVGKTWHPMFVTSCYPDVLHWGGGLPFNVLGRAPQFRYTRKLGDRGYAFIAALSEMDFKSNGPDGADVKYVQQASIPEFSAQVKYDFAKGFTLGATAGYKFLKPMVVNSAGLKTDEMLSSYQMNAWMTVKTDKLVWNLQTIYGQNMYNFVMIGGYGVKGVKANGDYEYTNVKTSSIWSDLHTRTGNVRYGLFAGYTKNLGADDNLAMNGSSFVGLYSRGSNIDYIYQFGPRVEFHSGSFMIGTQALYTAAAYGTTQINGKVADSKEVGSTRVSVHFKYSF